MNKNDFISSTLLVNNKKKFPVGINFFSSSLKILPEAFYRNPCLKIFFLILSLTTIHVTLGSPSPKSQALKASCSLHSSMLAAPSHEQLKKQINEFIKHNLCQFFYIFIYLLRQNIFFPCPRLYKKLMSR